MKPANVLEPAAALTAIAVLIGGSLLILLPFISIILWAAILVFATWGPYMTLTRWLRGNRTAAAVLFVSALMVFALGPIFYAGVELGTNIGVATSWVREHINNGLPALPEQIAALPLVGTPIEQWWTRLAAGDSVVIDQLKSFVAPVTGFALTIGAALGQGLLMLLFSLVVAVFFYLGGETSVRWLRGGMIRIAGERGDNLLNLASSTVRSVIYGIIGTALAQGALAAVGFAVAGVPGAATLGLLCCFLSLVPIGPALVWGPAAFWLYNGGETGWAIFMVIWGVGVVSMVDNILKPLFIGRGTKLPFLLIMLGVLGGALVFGLLGVFIGPTLLSVAYAVLGEWVRADEATTTANSATTPTT